MLLLIAIGLLAGLIAGVSPCVLPMLPVLFFAGGSPGATTNTASIAGGPEPSRATSSTSVAHRAGLRQPLLIILGLVSSFSVFTLVGSAVLTALHLPQDALRWAGLIVLTLVGLGLLLPRVEQLLQRPFRRLPGAFGRNVTAESASRRRPVGGFILGLGLGTLYVPCAGPVLAAISIAGSSGRVSGGIVALTVAFAVGVALPLFVFALAGSGMSRRMSAYRRRSRMFRIAGGSVMVLLAAALTFNLTDGLQRGVPGYTQALQDKVENNAAARSALAALDGPRSGTPSPQGGATSMTASGPVVTCVSHATTLANCGAAPQIIGIQAWLNTPDDQPLSLAQLRGKVVLINFWTFSCINCQRALPAIKSWYADYQNSGLVVIGVHTPEFAYEHELANVKNAISSDGVRYPVAVDNSSATWRNYNNAYWPAQYLIDAQGVIRHVVFGEGGYADSEALIRALLRAADPTVALPAPVDPQVPAG